MSVTGSCGAAVAASSGGRTGRNGKEAVRESAEKAYRAAADVCAEYGYSPSYWTASRRRRGVSLFFGTCVEYETVFVFSGLAEERIEFKSIYDAASTSEKYAEETVCAIRAYFSDVGKEKKT